jgi:hypothetical protein
MDDERTAPSAVTLPRITLPGLPPPTPEEIERRRVLVAEARALRDEIGPIGIRIDDIIHELRGGDERFDK